MSTRPDTRPTSLAAAALEQARAALEGAEVAVEATSHEMALTRFAESVIHQNVAEALTTVALTVHHEGHTASASGSVASSADLPALVARVVAAAGVAPRDAGWPGLAPVADPGASIAPDPATRDATPLDRAEVVRAFVDGAGGLETAGYARTTRREVAFVNSAGQAVQGEAAECGLAGVARAPLADGSGMADGVARAMPVSLADLDARALGARAGAKAGAWLDPVELEPGRYEVVLEPDAVSDVLGNLASWALTGRMVTEQRSFVELGADQLDPALTLVDDPGAVGVGFDAEGTPSARLTFVDAGRAVAVAHSRRTAAEAGAAPTGHSAAGWLGVGAMPRHLGIVPAGGAPAGEVEGPVCDSSAAELVAGVERGILVSDLWYTRVLDSRALVLTGLTRNGLWLIEDGRVTRPLRNFRFTQSYSAALAPGQVLGVGRTATAIPGDTYTATSPRFGCPALHLASWNFTGGASG